MSVLISLRSYRVFGNRRCIDELSVLSSYRILDTLQALYTVIVFCAIIYIVLLSPDLYATCVV